MDNAEGKIKLLTVTSNLVLTFSLEWNTVTETVEMMSRRNHYGANRMYSPTEMEKLFAVLEAVERLEIKAVESLSAHWSVKASQIAAPLIVKWRHHRVVRETAHKQEGDSDDNGSYDTKDDRYEQVLGLEGLDFGSVARQCGSARRCQS